MVLDGKSSPEHAINVGVPQDAILGLYFSYYTLMTFLMMLSVMLLSMLMILISKCDQASDLWHQLEFASELESDLRDTVEWGRK